MSDGVKRGRFADLVDAIHGWWNASEGDKDAGRRKVGEEVTRALPDPVNATSALDEKKRRRKKLLDDALAQDD